MGAEDKNLTKETFSWHPGGHVNHYINERVELNRQFCERQEGFNVWTCNSWWCCEDGRN